MRTHAEIIAKAGDDAVAQGLGLKKHQPRDWRLRNSIPAEYWSALDAAGIATLAELADAAAARRTGAAA